MPFEHTGPGGHMLISDETAAFLGCFAHLKIVVGIEGRSHLETEPGPLTMYAFTNDTHCSYCSTAREPDCFHECSGCLMLNACSLECLGRMNDHPCDLYNGLRLHFDRAIHRGSESDVVVKMVRESSYPLSTFYKFYTMTGNERTPAIKEEDYTDTSLYLDFFTVRKGLPPPPPVLTYTSWMEEEEPFVNGMM